MSEVRFPSEMDGNVAEVGENATPLIVSGTIQKDGDLCPTVDMKMSRILRDADKENVMPIGVPGQPTSTVFKSITNHLQQTPPTVSNYSIQFQYQLRRPVESWKYHASKNNDGSVVFSCSLCRAIYKHKKSLNKHWKDKHTVANGNAVANLDESDSQNDSSLIEGLAASETRPSTPVHRMRASLRPLLQESPSSTMVKRRRSDISTSSTSQYAPLDLSIARPKENDAALERVNEVNVCAPLRDRSIITLLIQSALDALNAEPHSVQTTDAVSASTSSLLRAVGGVLVGSTEPRTEPVTPSNDRRRSEEGPVPCQICSYVGRWHSEVKAHVVNHSSHKMFGCCFCNYRSKWKWDVAKHMRKCLNARNVSRLPNEALIRMIVFHPPPPDDILFMYYSESASSAGSGTQPSLPPQLSSTTFNSSSQAIEQTNAPDVEVPMEPANDDCENLKNDESLHSSVPTDPPVLEPAVKSEEEEEEVEGEMSQEEQPSFQTQGGGVSDPSAQLHSYILS